MSIDLKGRGQGYSDVAVARGGGDLVFVAGQVGWDERRRIVSADFAEQFDQALANFVAALRAGGAEPRDVARMTIHVTDRDAYLAARRALRRSWAIQMGDHYPAITLVVVAALLEPGAQVEIDGTAVRRG